MSNVGKARCKARRISSELKKVIREAKARGFVVDLSREGKVVKEDAVKGTIYSVPTRDNEPEVEAWFDHNGSIRFSRLPSW